VKLIPPLRESPNGFKAKMKTKHDGGDAVPASGEVQRSELKLKAAKHQAKTARQAVRTGKLQLKQMKKTARRAKKLVKELKGVLAVARKTAEKAAAKAKKTKRRAPKQKSAARRSKNRAGQQRVASRKKSRTVTPAPSHAAVSQRRALVARKTTNHPVSVPSIPPPPFTEDLEDQDI
jgi:hypothetical protein